MAKRKSNLPTPTQIASMTAADWKAKLAEMEENLLQSHARSLEAQFNLAHSQSVLNRLQAIPKTRSRALIGLSLIAVAFIISLIVMINFSNFHPLVIVLVAFTILGLGWGSLIYGVAFLERKERKVQRALAFEDAIKEKLHPAITALVLLAMKDSKEMNAWFEKELGADGQEILAGLAENPELLFGDALEMARELR